MRTILTVDDDILFLQALHKQVNFAGLGYDRTLSATSVNQALDILQRESVDVLLCDIEMPGKSGLELVHWMAEQKHPAVVLLLTCHSSFSYAQEAIGLEVFDYLLKPIRAEILEERLAQALRKRNERLFLEAHREELSQQPEESDSDLVSRICAYIETHIESELTRAQLGKALFMNQDYVARVFREEKGQSLNDYIRDRRIAHAKQLLRETDLPLTEICVQVGYAYNTYFFNTFKKNTGLSPNEYRTMYARKH